MTQTFTPGAIFRQLIKKNNTKKPTQIVGTINAYTALQAEQAGHQALYLSGAGVSNASYGLPDLGMTSREDVLIDVRRITAKTNLPLLVDIDTGWGSSLNIHRTIQDMIRAGAAGVHIEDQVTEKRCGHRPNKKIVSAQEMQARIKAAVDARYDASFVIMARTDAFSNEGLSGAIDRANLYIESGADMLFPEAMHTLSQYKTFCTAVSVPVLANLTEFGSTPLFYLNELASTGISMALYPLTAFRAMSLASQKTYSTIFNTGSQTSLLSSLQKREDLYKTLNYTTDEAIMDQYLHIL
ncbi:MAG: methylisocitrate lyase [Endozoicomonadaceae bacterium]|nr:methylisocitrate lyase [Endozoicomonadaceae bacterium]